jgi:type III pantothenate kinase
VASFSRGLGIEKVEFFGRDLPVPMKTKVRKPEKVGTDRLLAALAAKELRGAPCIVVSAGTAITVDLVDAQGCFAGGAIAPGFHLAARALHEQTALLPLVEPARPAEPAGQDTTSAVQSGVYWSCAGGVLALVEHFKELPGCGGAAVVCTGSDASLLLPVLPGGDSCAEPDLLFKGMAVALGLQP